MNIAAINNPDDPRLQAYRATRDADLLREHNLFMAEGRFIVRLLLSSGCRYSPDSLLVTQPALDSLADAVGAMGEKPIYLVPQDLMNGIIGFNIHRGCIAACDRGRELSVDELLGGIDGNPDETGATDGRSTGIRAEQRKPVARETPATVCILEDLANHDNVGGIFRSAAAFGCAGVLLSDRCCDPLYRKAIRVSMGGCLTVPFARMGSRVDRCSASGPGTECRATRELLIAHGFRLVALALRDDAIDISSASDLFRGRVALLLGAEGPGLSDEVLATADAIVRIPIEQGPGAVDSLNVAVAAGIALHECAKHRA